MLRIPEALILVMGQEQAAGKASTSDEGFVCVKERL